MGEPLAGYVDSPEVVFSVYFVNGQAATFTLKSAEDINLAGEFITVSIGPQDKALIDRKHVCYTRTQHVTRRRKAPVPGEAETPA